MQELDLITCPLVGTNLIEASAGTGKTYTISGLFLRLLLERQLAVHEILVVTFTEAATEELRDRIRRMVRQALQAFTEGHSHDHFFSALLQKHPDHAAASRALTLALQGFDEAAVFTIHGFCQRALRENAFESGEFFDLELLADQSALVKRAVDDFWRRHFYAASPLFLRHALFNRRCTPESLRLMAGRRTSLPFLKTIPDQAMPETGAAEQAFRDVFMEARAAWPSARPQVEAILSGEPGLNRTRYRPDQIPSWLMAMDRYLAGGPQIETFLEFTRFTPAILTAATKKGHAPPAHPWFDLCGRLQEQAEALAALFDTRLRALKRQLLQDLPGELARLKRERRCQFYDDLLLNLYFALEGSRGPELAKAIGSRFRAALIDEFQDTDPLQYAIFQRIYCRAGGILFLIGDPKQAIYSFRGADIFTYMDAAAEGHGACSTLGTNWRSDPALVQAVNCIFFKRANAFLFPEILFWPVAPASKDNQSGLLVDGQAGPPFRLWFASEPDGEPSDRQLSKDNAMRWICAAVAEEIAHLLNLGAEGRARLGDRPLAPRDVAVLVRTNEQARRLQAALRSVAIPSVLQGTDNLFASDEAREMEVLMAAVLEPANARRVRAALVCAIFSRDSEHLLRLLENEELWAGELARFQDYHVIWRDAGFMQMIHTVFAAEGVRGRLLASAGGERSLTNLLHLAEVLHEASATRKMGMPGLLKWLSGQRQAPSSQVEEFQLRLESDDEAVRIVTIHKAKGLEYPVVFCPFAWEGVRNLTEDFLFHNEIRQLTLDLGSPEIDRHRDLARFEELAENLRLLYVALTRAKNRCYLVWGPFRSTESSALAYLFHGQEEDAPFPEAVIDNLSSHVKSLTTEEMWTDLLRLQDQAGGAIAVSALPKPQAGIRYQGLRAAPVSLCCREFSRQLEQNWRVASFSSLAAGGSAHDKIPFTELPDRDALTEAPLSDADQGTMAPSFASFLDFPRGARPGIFLHELMEHLDFAEPDPTIRINLVAEKLQAYGYDPAWQEAINAMLDNVLACPLPTGAEPLVLSGVSCSARLTELEFYFPLRPITAQGLRRIFASHGSRSVGTHLPEERLGRLHFAPVQGFLKGFMDLVFLHNGRFYLVDWKSNFLGRRIEDYARENLALVMEQEQYILQYHLYTVALDRYLALRVPDYAYDRHFGGIYYLFLRGIEPGRGDSNGVYFDRPVAELVDELTQYLIALDASE